jgi:hypothetical protein
MSLSINHDPFDPQRWFYKLLILICLFVLVILCNACSCEYHLKKAENKCGKSRMSDTLIVHDTIVTNSVSRDTTFFYNQKDTVVIREGKLLMKYFYRDSTVYLRGECLPDTVFYEKQIITNSLELKTDPLVKYRWWIIGLFLVLLIIAIFRK